MSVDNDQGDPGGTMASIARCAEDSLFGLAARMARAQVALITGHVADERDQMDAEENNDNDD